MCVAQSLAQPHKVPLDIYWLGRIKYWFHLAALVGLARSWALYSRLS